MKVMNDWTTTFEVVENVILPQLNQARSTGSNKWMACCPAHEDKSPSFSLRLAEDGRILMHCFSGCSINEICDSLHVEPQWLFPIEGHFQPVRQPVNIPLEDKFFIECCKAAIRKGKTLTTQDKQRYMQAIRKRRSVR